MRSIKNQMRNFDKWRRSKMSNLESLLYQLVNNKKNYQSELLPAEQVRSIIIVRNNRRIGNMFFLIPFVKLTRKLYPNSQITLMLNEPWQASFFDGLGVDQFLFSHFSLKSGFDAFKLIKEQKKVAYDLALVPCSSIEDVLFVSVLNAKNKVGRFNPKRALPFTHTFEKNDNERHSALNNLFIFNQLGHSFSRSDINHKLEFSTEELEFAQQKRAELATEQTKVIAYFRGARGNKLLDETTWTNILNRFAQATDQKITWIEIISPDISAPLTMADNTYQNKNMRQLAAVLKEMDAFICCDTGPLHLADAAGAKCIGLYNKTNPEVYGVIGDNCVNVTDIEQFDAQQIFQQISF